MREFGSTSLGLAGSILIAHPNLLDPNFKRTVLFIPINDPQEGSFGLVLNRPTGKKAADFVEDQDLGALAGVPVFIGGPVSRDQLTFVSFIWNAQKESVECQTQVGIEDAWKLMDESKASVRAFVGYAGWSKGQLEAELTQKAWLVQRPDRDIVDPENCVDLWKTIVSEHGPWFKLLAAAPDDPSMN